MTPLCDPAAALLGPSAAPGDAPDTSGTRWGVTASWRCRGGQGHGGRAVVSARANPCVRSVRALVCLCVLKRACARACLWRMRVGARECTRMRCRSYCVCYLLGETNMSLSPVAPLLQDWQRRDKRSHLLSGDNTAVCSFPHPPTPIGLWPDWQSVQAASHRLSPGDWAAQPSPCRRGSRPDVGLPPPQSPTARGRSRSIWFAGKCSAAPTATTCRVTAKLALPWGTRSWRSRSC